MLKVLVVLVTVASLGVTNGGSALAQEEPVEHRPLAGFNIPKSQAPKFAGDQRPDGLEWLHYVSGGFTQLNLFGVWLGSGPTSLRVEHIVAYGGGPQGPRATHQCLWLDVLRSDLVTVAQGTIILEYVDLRCIALFTEFNASGELQRLAIDTATLKFGGGGRNGQDGEFGMYGWGESGCIDWWARFAPPCPPDVCC